MSMLEQMINGTIDKKISVDYPHLRYPALVKARVTRASEYGSPWYRYNLKILDKNGEVDEHFPEVPEVLSRQRYEKGATVAVGLLYGELDPYILGEVAL